MNDKLREKLAEGANASDFPACYWEGGEWMYREEVVPRDELITEIKELIQNLIVLKSSGDSVYSYAETVKSDLQELVFRIESGKKGGEG